MPGPGYPHVPGHQDTDTSLQAAPEHGQALLLRQRVKDVLARLGGATADECATELAESILSVRPRLTELKKMKLIEDTGIRRKNASGRNAAVMRLAANI